MKLYRHRDDATIWVGEDKHGALMAWPAAPGGWAKRTTYAGQRRQLEEVEPALARGTRWPGGGRAPKPRSISGEASTERLAIRATPTEMREWQRRASEEGKPLAGWARDELTAAVSRPRILLFAALVLGGLAGCDSDGDESSPSCSTCVSGTLTCANLGPDSLAGTADDRDCSCVIDGQRETCPVDSQ